MDEDRKFSRKAVLKAALAAGVAAPVALVGGPALARTNFAGGQKVEPTPYCHDGDEPTIDQTEGPYFKPDSPERSVLVDQNTPGQRLTVSGYVFGLSCQPIGRALLDFWQADVNGAYDNDGFNFRGHQYTNDLGEFKLTTIVPGLYPGRTRHIHVKVQAPGEPILTTQLYFPGEPRNNTDTIFDSRLLMTVRDAPNNAKEAAFDFVLNVQQTPTGGPSTGPTSPTGQPGGTTWTAGKSYPAGTRVTFNGVSYVCLQGHTAQRGWEPPNAPALWQKG
ncbi:dioxygenase [Amycolatopsis sp. AA4]|uniref:dioxygenase family protein n=1 Tax=Actinomycetes TaxID=1760 RepID=UPI0001B57A21|nr:MULTISPECIES: carbohydrate-binding protein [Actinomycetes]ATY09835.1 dioxygenase [Amycolatopsis sp. AA4]